MASSHLSSAMKDVVYFTTNAGATYAITADKGEQLWRYDAGGASGGSVTLDEIVVGSDNGGVSAIIARRARSSGWRRQAVRSRSAHDRWQACRRRERSHVVRIRP